MSGSWDNEPDSSKPFDEATIECIYESLTDGNGFNSEVCARIRRADAVLQAAEKFIREQRIGCADTVYQCDWVIENAYEFIQEVCEAVGYYKETD